VLVVKVARSAPPRFARVRHVSPKGDGRWSVCCGFALRLTEDELHTLAGR
jgi:hypothetical protein